MRTMRSASTVLVSIAILISLAGCGRATEESSGISVRFSDGLPPTHYLSKNFSQVFIAKSEAWAREHGHSLTVEHFPSGQLGDFPDQIDNMNNGVFDSGLVASAYNTDQMPASDVFNLSDMADDSETLTKAYYAVIRDRNSVVYQRDFAQNTMVPLATAVAPTYQLALTSDITGIDSFDNKRIRSSGGVQNDVIRALGGIPVSMSLAEQYESLERGVLDGGVFNTPSMVDNKTGEVLTSFTPNADAGSFGCALALSEQRWNQLPDWARQALVEGGRAASMTYAKRTDGLGAAATETLEKDLHVKPVRLSSEQQAALSHELRNVSGNWASHNDSFDGRTALREARRAIAKAS